MSRRTTNALLMAALLATLVLNVLTWLGPADTRRRTLEYFPDMARSPRFNTFSPNPNFADGKTLQPPVAGTIPLDDPLLVSSGREAERVPRPGEAMSNPFSSSDTAAVARGQALFATFCRPCHGVDAAGDGPVTAHGYPAPPSLTSGGAVAMDDVRLFRIVTRGTSDMPAYASQIAPSDRWKVILYLRGLQRGTGEPRAEDKGGIK
jgi:mono/diheme cytochrome c family protein